MNIQSLLQAKSLWNQFKANHPKFEPFMNAVKTRGIPEGTVVEIEVRYPNDAGTMKTNLKISEGDLELLGLAKGLLK